MVANFRTEDAQRRLLTAVIAAHPELKLNFKGRYRSTCIYACTSPYLDNGPVPYFECWPLQRALPELSRTSEGSY